MPVEKTFGCLKGADVKHSRSCKFIEGTRPYGDNPWCGKKAIHESSYCEKHHQLCHIPMDQGRSNGFNKGAERIARETR